MSSLCPGSAGLSLSPTRHPVTRRQTPAQYSLMEKDALKVAQEMQAEYWAVSSLTGGSLSRWGMQTPGSGWVRGHSGGLLPRHRRERAGFLLPRGSADL